MQYSLMHFYLFLFEITLVHISIFKAFKPPFYQQPKSTSVFNYLYLAFSLMFISLARQRSEIFELIKIIFQLVCCKKGKHSSTLIYTIFFSKFISLPTCFYSFLPSRKLTEHWLLGKHISKSYY